MTGGLRAIVAGFALGSLPPVYAAEPPEPGLAEQKSSGGLRTLAQADNTPRSASRSTPRRTRSR